MNIRNPIQCGRMDQDGHILHMCVEELWHMRNSTLVDSRWRSAQGFFFGKFSLDQSPHCRCFLYFREWAARGQNSAQILSS